MMLKVEKKQAEVVLVSKDKADLEHLMREKDTLISNL